MSFGGSGGDDQSEDGELRHSPVEIKNKEEILDFSLSDEDGDTVDSLDIKPPQANRLSHSINTSSSGRNKRRERNRVEGRSRHGRSERHRDQDRSHGHREKHHRERSNREREAYRDKEHFRVRDMYREKEMYRDVRYSETSMISYKDSKYVEISQYGKRDEHMHSAVAGSSRDMRYMEQKKFEEKRKEHDRYNEKDMRELRYLQEQEKYRRYEEKQERRLKSTADQALDDLRERLLDKKRLKESSEDYTKHYEKESRRRARVDHNLENVVTLEQEAEMYVKEIIDLSGNLNDVNVSSSRERSSKKDRHHGHGSRRDKQMEKLELRDEDDMSGAGSVGVVGAVGTSANSASTSVEKKLTEAECEEQELRKEKLLQAEREIARQKEQYQLERERRHQRRLERQEKRRLQEEQLELENQQRKRQRITNEIGQYKNKDLSIVTVSDASSPSSHSESSNSNSTHSSERSQRSRSNSPHSDSERSQDEEYNSNEAISSSDDDDDDDDDNNDNNENTGANDDAAKRGETIGDGKQRERRKKRKYKSDNDEENAADNNVNDDDEDDDMPEAYRDRERNRDRSVSRSRSKSVSPVSNGQLSNQKEKDTGSGKENNSESKPKSPEPVTKKLDDGLPPYFPAIQGCRSVEEFQCLNRIEEGTYGVVYRARDKRTEEIVALKRLKMEKEKEGFPITSLREINTLLKGQHPNIVTVREIVVGSNMDKIFIVMDYVEHDLKSLMETMRNRRQVFVPGEVKCLLKQLLGAVAHLHDNWILHRDLKTSNLLLSHKGILKVGDFGLAREYGSPLKAYTPIVVTLWYRAPELLLCCKEYSTPIDMWSVGCIFAELLLMNALFPGKSEVDQLNRIFKDLGTPNERIWPGYNELPAVKKMKFTDYPVSQLRTRFHMLTETGLNLLQRFLTYDPAQRITAEDGLKHSYFTEAPLPIDPAMFPTWPAKSELGHRKALAASPKPPSGGREYKQLGDGEDTALGFHMGGTTSAIETRRLPMGGGFSLKF